MKTLGVRRARRRGGVTALPNHQNRGFRNPMRNNTQHIKPKKPFAIDMSMDSRTKHTNIIVQTVLQEVVTKLINDVVLSATLECNNRPIVVTEWSFVDTNGGERGGNDDDISSGEDSGTGEDSSNDEERQEVWQRQVIVHRKQKTGSSQTYDDDLHRGVKPAECKWIARFGNGPSQEENNRPTFQHSGFHYPRGATSCSDGSQRHGTCRCGQLVDSGKADRCGCRNAKCSVCTRAYRTFITHAKKRRLMQNVK